MYNNLLLNIEDFKFTSAWSSRYKNLSGQFTILKVYKGWRIVFPLYIKLSTKEIFKTRSQAANIAHQMVKEKYPEQSVSLEVQRISPGLRVFPEYFVGSRSPIRLDGSSGNWEITQVITHKIAKFDKFSATKFKSRYAAVKEIHKKVSLVLPCLYYDLEQRSPGKFDQHFSALIEYGDFAENYEINELWWLLFLKPEKDIIDVFKN